MVEKKPYNQYLIKIDGTGRTTLRNRKHLRKFTPFQKKDKKYPEMFTDPLVAKSSSAMKDNPVITGSSQIVQPETTPIHEVGNSKVTQPEVTPLPEVDDDLNSSVGPTPPEEPLPDVTADNQIQEKIPDVTKQPDKPETRAKKIPLALRRLLPHNKAGKLES